MMNLGDEEKKLVAGWLAGGASLAEVQRRMKEECGVSATYMDVRFLVDDLKLEVIEQPKQSEVVERLEAAKQEGEQATPTGRVSVTMDALTKPQAMASGKVTFSDGETAEWMLDQTGRLGLNPAKPGYRPSQADVLTFQEELQRVVQGLG